MQAYLSLKACPLAVQLIGFFLYNVTLPCSTRDEQAMMLTLMVFLLMSSINMICYVIIAAV